MVMGGKVQENKKQKKEALLENALELFLSKGLQDTSIADIAKKAGVAKGTFYLYFKDKIDLRNILIAHEASKLFEKATEKLDEDSEEWKQMDFEEQMITIIDHIINELVADKRLLSFISKNLSWGYFKFALLNNRMEEDVDFYKLFENMIANANYQLKDPEIMIFLIIELVSSTIYSCILYDEPVGMEEIKPYLYNGIRSIVRCHRTIGVEE
ncbi:MAG: TetR/AcrR family transcriptional regulator [Lachnospiraceae bacterium]|nr:TetR/AcrR family transcriptional regulator [Lachnospiraceae bacterium]